MFSQLCQDIRALTLQAETYVTNRNIEQCLAILVERQQLLEALKAQFILSKNDPDTAKKFTSILLWVKEQDELNQAKVEQFKAQSKEKSVTQVKIKKALHHYKKVT